MTFWPQSLNTRNENVISTIDNSLSLTLLRHNQVCILKTSSQTLQLSVKYALLHNSIKHPLQLLLGIQSSKENNKQELLKIVKNLDILIRNDNVYSNSDCIYFIFRKETENILQILLKSDSSLIEIDSDFAFCQWYRIEEEESLYYSIQKLPWNIHGHNIKEIISKGLDLIISLKKEVSTPNVTLHSGIQKEIHIQDVARFTLYLDSRITVVFSDRTIVKTDLHATKFHVLGRDGEEVVLCNPIGFESYIRLVKQFIEWNKNGCPTSNTQNVNVLEKLSRSKQFLKELN